MYQNITFLPLSSADGTVDHIGIIVYDVTDVAVSRMALEQANEALEELRKQAR